MLTKANKLDGGAGVIPPGPGVSERVRISENSRNWADFCRKVLHFYILHDFCRQLLAFIQRFDENKKLLSILHKLSENCENISLIRLHRPKWERRISK